MNNFQLFPADIQKMIRHIDPDLLNCLLIIRYLSSMPAAAQPDGSTLTPHNCKALWQKLAEEACRADSQMLPAIKQAIDRVKADLPFAPDLSACCNADERTLKALVQQLAKLPASFVIPFGTFMKGTPQNVCDPAPNSGDFYTPTSIIQWMAGLLEIEHDGSLYDPCCGSGSMLWATALSYPCQKLRLYGQSLDSKSRSVCRMNLILRGLSADLGQRPANTLLEDLHQNRSFDYILANPPFNLPDWDKSSTASENIHWQYGLPPRKNANFAWLQHILRHLSPTGRAAVLLPNGTLTTQTHAEQEIRRRILRDGWVEAIFALPAGLFHGTRVPCCAWIINKDACRDTVLLADARRLDFSDPQDIQKTAALLHQYRRNSRLQAAEWYAAVPIGRIAENGCVLSPNLYTSPKPLPLASDQQLSDDFKASADALCEYISSPDLCESIRKWKTAGIPRDWKRLYLTDVYEIAGGVTAKKAAFGQGVPMADTKAVIHHMFLPESLSAQVQLPKEKACKYALRAGDILLSRTSESVDELACCSAVLKDHTAVYSAYLKRLRPYDVNRIDPRYAAAYFRSRFYRQEIQRVSVVYTTRANINLQQLSMIRLYAPGTDWQQAFGKTLHSVIRFGQEHCSKELDMAIHHFVEAFIERFITYPILSFQKECDQR